jgi:hypothetical protein
MAGDCTIPFQCRRQLERQHRLQRLHFTLKESDSRKSTRHIFFTKRSYFESRFLSRMLGEASFVPGIVQMTAERRMSSMSARV